MPTFGFLKSQCQLLPVQKYICQEDILPHLKIAAIMHLYRWGNVGIDTDKFTNTLLE